MSSALPPVAYVCAPHYALGHATAPGQRRPLSSPAVDFEIAHSVPADIDTVAAALLDRRFQRSLDGIGALDKRELLSQDERSDGTVVRRARCVLGIDLGPAKKFVGDAEPAWIEVATWDPGAMTWEWVVEPEVAADLLESDGAIALEADGDHTVRVVTGRVGVKVPFYGARVERAIVDGVTRAYEDEAERLREWLRSTS